MKITHISLCGSYTDDFSYQDNLLPKYHKKLGYEVSMITSKYYMTKFGDIDIDSRDEFFNKFGVKIVRLKNKYSTTAKSKFKRYCNVYETIEKEKPDILFIHGCQFLDIKDIVKYIKKTPNIKVYVDNHADFSNSATNWVSKNILHKIIWKHCAQLIEPYTTKFYGVLPARVDFLKDIYKIPSKKVELLVMGADDEKVQNTNNKITRRETRAHFNVDNEDFLIITGGKIDLAKLQVLNLMKVVDKMNNKNIKLIVYGSVVNSMREEVNALAKSVSIQYIGWINNDESYKLFAAADLMVFPGRHSVYWEQAAGMGKPMVTKYWPGTTHIDFGGNCEFIYKDSINELYSILEVITSNNNKYKRMQKIAASDKHKNFLYSNIAKKALELIN